MRKCNTNEYVILLQNVVMKKSVNQKMQNVIFGFLFDFLTLRASRVHPSSALSEL